MNVILLVSGVSLVIFILLFIWFDKKEWDAASGVAVVLAFLAGLSTFASFMTLLDTDTNQYEREQQVITTDCATRGGVRSDNGLCIANNKPIQYKDGSWIK